MLERLPSMQILQGIQCSATSIWHDQEHLASLRLLGWFLHYGRIGRKSDVCHEYLETCENTLQMDLRCETCPWCLISYAASVWWCQAANGRAEKSRMNLRWHYTSCLLAYGLVYQPWPIISNPFATPSLDELQCVPERYMTREVVDVKACNSRRQLLLSCLTGLFAKRNSWLPWY